MARDIKGQFTCAAGDQWDYLALMFYKDEKYAADLMSANPEYSGVTVFSGGEVILIPYIEETEAEYSEEEAMANTTAPWRT